MPVRPTIDGCSFSAKAISAMLRSWMTARLGGASKVSGLPQLSTVTGKAKAVEASSEKTSDIARRFTDFAPRLNCVGRRDGFRSRRRRGAVRNIEDRQFAVLGWM